MQRLVASMLAIVGIVHLLPLPGLVGAAQLHALYGVDIAGPNMAILMQHRAVLLAIVGGLCLAAIVHRPLRLAALVVALLSVASFLAIAWWVGGYNALLARVVAIDIAVLLCLGVALLAHAAAARGRTVWRAVLAEHSSDAEQRQNGDRRQQR